MEIQGSWVTASSRLALHLDDGSVVELSISDLTVAFDGAHRNATPDGRFALQTLSRHLGEIVARV